MELKLRKTGTQFRVLGLIVFLIGVLMAILEADSGIVILALGLIVAVQGSIIEYAFK